MGGSDIPSAPDIRDLGVTVSGNLNFSNHISKISCCAYYRLNLIFRAFTTRDIEILVKTYITYVRPMLEYNTPVWSPFCVKISIRSKKFKGTLLEGYQAFKTFLTHSASKSYSWTV